MSFGNFQLHRLEPSQTQESRQGYSFGRSIDRWRPSGRDTQSAQQIQPVRQTSEGYSGKSKTDLTVLTAEGDRVTISLAAQVKYSASSKTGPGGSSQTVSTSTSSQLRVAVDGDLNEAELKDLGTLLSNLARATNQATSQTPSTPTTNPSPAVPDTSAVVGFAGLASLAAFAYSYKQTVEAGSLVRSRG